MKFGKYTTELLNKIGVEPMINHSVTTDEFLDILGCTVDEDGDILFEGENTGIGFEQIEYENS